MRMAQREDAVAARKVEIRLAARIPNRGALRAHFHRRTRKLHYARQRRIHELLVVLEDFRHQLLRRARPVKRFLRIDHAATSGELSSRSIVSSMTAPAS